MKKSIPTPHRERLLQYLGELIESERLRHLINREQRLILASGLTLLKMLIPRDHKSEDAIIQLEGMFREFINDDDYARKTTEWARGIIGREFREFERKPIGDPIGEPERDSPQVATA